MDALGRPCGVRKMRGGGTSGQLATVKSGDTAFIHVSYAGGWLGEGLTQSDTRVRVLYNNVRRI